MSLPVPFSKMKWERLVLEMERQHIAHEDSCLMHSLVGSGERAQPE